MSDQDNVNTDLETKELEQTAQANVDSTTTDLSTLLGGIKNDEGAQKYATPEEALKGAAHAQEYIRELKNGQAAMEEELRKVKEELNKRDDVKSVVEAALSSREPAQPEVSTPTATGLGQEDVLQLLERRDAEKQAKSNIQDVGAKLAARFGAGDKLKETLSAKANELGMTNKDLLALAAKSPQAVLAMFPESKASVDSIETKVNTQAVTPHSKEIEKVNFKIGATMDDYMEVWNRVNPTNLK